jgi:hypothetical protein
MSLSLQEELELLRTQNAALKAEQEEDEEPIRQRRGRQGTPKRWEAALFDGNDNLQTIIIKGKEVTLCKGFNMAQEADQYAFNTLSRLGSSDWYAIVSLNGSHISSRINRDEALGRLVKHKTPTAIFQKSGKGGSLAFGVKAHQTRVTFSGG